MNTIITFIGGLLAGFILAYFTFVFDAEKSRLDFRIQILREVWQGVLLAKSLSVNLDPSLGSGPSGEDRDTRVKRRLEEYGPAYLEAKRIVRFNEPFYPQPIHDLANSLLLEANMNATLVGSESPDRLQDYGTRIDAYKKTMDALSAQLCKLIREDAGKPSLNPFKRPSSSR